MKHKLYGQAWTKTKKGVYPRWIVVTPTATATRAEMHQAAHRSGRMETRGKFAGGAVGSLGIYLMERYLAGRNMARHPGWFGWKKKDGSDKYRDMMKSLRFVRYKLGFVRKGTLERIVT